MAKNLITQTMHHLRAFLKKLPNCEKTIYSKPMANTFAVCNSNQEIIATYNKVLAFRLRKCLSESLTLTSGVRAVASGGPVVPGPPI